MADDRASLPTTHAFLVEAYWPRPAVDAFKAAGGRLLETIARLRREGVGIRYVSGTLVPADEVAYWVLDSASAEVVALAFARAEIGVDRTVEALELAHGRPARPREAPALTGGTDVLE